VQVFDLAARAGQEPLRGHHGATGVAFSADGSQLITAGADRSIKRWDYPPRLARLPLRGGPLSPAAVAAARDGALVAWVARGGADQRDEGVYVRDLSGGEPRLVVGPQERALLAVALSPDGKLLATAAGPDDAPAELLVWEVATGKLLHPLGGHRSAVTALAFAPDGKRLFSADRDGQVRVWGMLEGKAERVLAGAAKPAQALAVSGDGRRLALAAGQGERVALTVWALADGEVAGRFSAGAGQALALDRAGGLLAHAEKGGAVRLLEVDTGASRGTRAMGMNEIACVAFSRDDSTLAVAGRGPGVRLWDVPTWQERAVLPGHRGGAAFVGFAGPGEGVLLTATEGGVARLWYRGRP
jgi:WD40 repeat protein